MAGRRGTIPVERLKPIVDRVISQLEKQGKHDEENGGGVDIMCEQIALTTGRQPDSVKRRVWTIRNGRDTYNPKKPKYPGQPASELFVRLLWENDLIWTTQRVGSRGFGVRWIWPTAGEAYDLLKANSIRYKVTHVTFETADAILTGLDLTHLWHTELEDLYFEGLAEAA